MNHRISSLLIALLFILPAQTDFVRAQSEIEEMRPAFRSASDRDCTWFNNNVRDVDHEPADVRDWLDKHQENILIESPDIRECLVHLAARDNAVHVLEWLETRGTDFAMRNILDLTPMYLIDGNNTIETMIWLESRGIDIEIHELGGATPMHDAAMYNAVDAMKWLQSRGVDVNIQGNGNSTPIHGAAVANAIDAVKWLAEQGADLNVRDYWCNTPLDLAMERNATETIVWLQENGGRTYKWNEEQGMENILDMGMVFRYQTCDPD